MTSKEILKKYWGYDAFRPLQEEIVESALGGKDTLALLPTGGGKSICFQVPAMAREGICIVVSPLIALMKDQVANLVKRNIKAIAVYSGMSAREIDIAIDNCVYGDIKFLYLSPERLATDLFRSRVEKMKVNLLAIDEAHCISQWGYDFRPPYLQIAEIRQLIPKVPVMALTATATHEVVKDIGEKLEMKNPNIFIKSFDRKNLTYAVIKEENKWQRLVNICNKVPGTGIVYVRNRRKTVETAKLLQQNNIKADFYHAGLDSITRDQKQNSWTSEKTRVIVSTNAFGMGIDKPNVRFVVHLDLPDSPEAYFQEAGRAGRDEKKAYAVLLFNNSDIIDLNRFFETSYPSIEFIKGVYNALGNYFQLAEGTGKDQRFEFSLQAFCDHYNLARINTFNALLFLEKEGYIVLSDALANPSKVLVLLQKEELYRFMVANPTHEKLIKTLLRSYTGLFSQFTRIDEKELAKRLTISDNEIANQLKAMHRMRVLHYEPVNTQPAVTFVMGRMGVQDIVISPENYQERKKYARERINAILEYTTHTKLCRSKMLLEYFGEKNAPFCDQCDVCLERNKAHISEMEFDEITQLAKPMLIKQPQSTQQLINNLKSKYTEKQVITAIQWMKDNQIIRYNPDNELLTWV